MRDCGRVLLPVFSRTRWIAALNYSARLWVTSLPCIRASSCCIGCPSPLSSSPSLLFKRLKSVRDVRIIDSQAPSSGSRRRRLCITLCRRGSLTRTAPVQPPATRPHTPRADRHMTAGPFLSVLCGSHILQLVTVWAAAVLSLGWISSQDWPPV